MSTRYIADTHLFDSYSLDWRAPQTLEEYAEDLIESWNSVVQDNDTVIHVGDVGNFSKATLEVLHQLKGHKVLVLGNHDQFWHFGESTRGIFEGVYDHIQQPGLFIKHKPTTERELEEGTYYIHGHHHFYDRASMTPAWVSYVKDTYRLNCAADIIHNRPKTLTELIICKEEMIQDRR